MFGAVFVRPELVFRGVELTPIYIASSYLLLPFKNSTGNYFPFLPVGSTLIYEVFFYLLLGGAIALFDSTKRYLAITCALTALCMLNLLTGAIPFYGSPIVVEFVFGIWIAHMHFTVPSPSKKLCALAGLVGVFGYLLLGFLEISDRGNWRSLQVGIPAAALVFFFVFSPNLKPRKFFRACGEGCYSIYLTHYPPFEMDAKVCLGR